MHIDCINRFEPLSEQADSSCREEHIDSLHVDVNIVECKVKALGEKGEEVKDSCMEFFIFQCWVVSVNRRMLESF